MDIIERIIISIISSVGMIACYYIGLSQSKNEKIFYMQQAEEYKKEYYKLRSKNK